ncbi:hypothetical protein MATL_G00231890 [Megalops atlanticus]|uniref:Uncharacterized protein n=1 Tax=Megalops atlanticus TaxID=7932 RepID=A0A9D3SWF0_MEGAT|nr:hypothetical protein MATL_G00231890 [Megalops atlanticus]
MLYHPSISHVKVSVCISACLKDISSWVVDRRLKPSLAETGTSHRDLSSFTCRWNPQGSLLSQVFQTQRQEHRGQRTAETQLFPALV